MLRLVSLAALFSIWYVLVWFDYIVEQDYTRPVAYILLSLPILVIVPILIMFLKFL